MEQGLVYAKDEKMYEIKPMAPPHLSRAVITTHIVESTKLVPRAAMAYRLRTLQLLKINVAGVQAKTKDAMAAQVSSSHLKR